MNKNKNKNISKEIKRAIPYITFLMTFALIIIIADLSPEKNLSIGRSEIYELNANWKVLTDNRKLEHVDLPYTIDEVGYDKVFKIEKNMDGTIPDGMALRIRASMQDITVRVNHEIIYESNRINESKLVFPEVSLWHLVELPEHVAGDTLSIEVKTKIKTFSGVLNPIFYGKKEALIYDIVYSNLTGLTVALTLLITGILSVIASIILSRIGDYRLFYLGLFSMSASIWMMSEMRVLQLITGNRFILGGISYLMLPLFTIALVKYLGVVVLGKYKRQIKGSVTVLYTMFFLSIILQMLGIVPFISITPIMLILIGCLIIWVLCVMLYECFILKNKKAGMYLTHLSVLIITGFLEISVFFTRKFDLLIFYSKLGFGIFMFFQFMESIKYFNNLLVLKSESKLLEKMAYRDILTGGNNRAAFERDLDEFLANDSSHNFRLALLDINNLKYINDTFGHSEGDLVIKRIYESTQNAFTEMGKCYRLGGDEFACLLKDVDEFKYKVAVQQLYDLIKNITVDRAYEVNIAIGEGVFSKSNTSNKVNFGDFFHEVDLLMYERKRASKNSRLSHE